MSDIRLDKQGKEGFYEVCWDAAPEKTHEDITLFNNSKSLRTLKDKNVFAIALNPVQHNVLYAQAKNGGVYIWTIEIAEMKPISTSLKAGVLTEDEIKSKDYRLKATFEPKIGINADRDIQTR